MRLQAVWMCVLVVWWRLSPGVLCIVVDKVAVGLGTFKIANVPKLEYVIKGIRRKTAGRKQKIMPSNNLNNSPELEALLGEAST